MHIVVIAWLYVTFAMSLAMPSIAAGVAFFAFVGVAPAALAVALALRRRRGGGPGRPAE